MFLIIHLEGRSEKNKEERIITQKIKIIILKVKDINAHVEHVHLVPKLSLWTQKQS